MIALLHGALGAACGTLLRHRPHTLIAALCTHLLVDAINHEEPVDEDGNLRVDLLALDASLLGLALLLVATRRGVFSPESLGAVVGCLPDVEHLLAKGMTKAVVHRQFPHARWPSRKMNISSQLVAGAIAWLAVLAYASHDGERAVPIQGTNVASGTGATPLGPAR